VLFQDNFRSLIKGFGVVVLLSGLAACGGGGGGGGSSSLAPDNDDTGGVDVDAGAGGGNSGAGVNTVTIEPLAATTTVDENAEVTLSITARGDGVPDLNYDWTVTYQGEAYAFSGQNTSSITLVAPEVDQPSVISVVVDMSLSGGSLLGDTRQLTVISITDLNPPQIAEEGKETELPSTESLQFSDVLVGSTWALTVYESTPSTAQNGGQTVDVESQFSYHRSAVITGVNASTLEFDSCGNSQSSSLDFDNYAEGTTCAIGAPEVKVYQDAQGFRAEMRCGDRISKALTFEKISDTTENVLGDLSLSFGTYAELENPTKLCGEVVTNMVKSVEGEDISLLRNSTTIRLISEYQGSPLEVFMFLGDLQNKSIFSLGSENSNGEKDHVSFKSELLPTINGISENEGGSAVISRSSMKNISGTFRVELIDSNLAEEEVQGEFSLILE